MSVFTPDPSGSQNTQRIWLKTGEDCFDSTNISGPTTSGAFITPSGSRFTSVYFDPCACEDFYFSAAVSDETTDLASGASQLTFRMPTAATISEVKASVTTAPSGGTLRVDILEEGISILNPKLTIDSGEETSVTAAIPAGISDSALAYDAEITVDILSVPSTPGAGLKIYLIGKTA